MDVDRNASRPPAWLNLSARLRLLMLVLLLPGLAFTVTASLLERQRVRSEAQAQLVNRARLAAGQAQQSIQDIQIRLALVTALNAVQTSVNGAAPQACDSLLQALAAGPAAGAHIAVWNLAGQLVCSSEAGGQPAESGHEAWFRRAVDSQAFAVGDFELTGSPGASTITFGYPLAGNNHDVLGVVSARLTLGELGSSLSGAELPADAVVTVFDPTGLVLARSVEALNWVGHSLPQADHLAAALTSGTNSMERADVDGVVRLTAFAQMIGPGGRQVYVSIGRPAAAASGAVDGALFVGLALTAAVTLAAVWLAARWSRQTLERPLQDLLAVSDQIAQGELATRARAETGGSEVDRLARAINQIAESREQIERQRQQGAAQGQSLDEQLRRSQARATQLETVAAGLSRAGTTAEVMEVILRQGASVLGAVSSTLLLLTDNEHWLKRSAHAGQPDFIDLLFPRFPVSSPLPAADVVRTGEAIWIQSAADYRARYPQLIEVINSTDYEAAVALPLRVAGRVIGVVMLSFPRELSVTLDTTTYLAALASLCVLGLERVGLKDLML